MDMSQFPALSTGALLANLSHVARCDGQTVVCRSIIHIILYITLVGAGEPRRIGRRVMYVALGPRYTCMYTVDVSGYDGTWSTEGANGDGRCSEDGVGRECRMSITYTRHTDPRYGNKHMVKVHARMSLTRSEHRSVCASYHLI